MSDVYLVWELQDGRWAARSKRNYPLPALAYAVGRTASAAIAAWKKFREQRVAELHRLVAPRPDPYARTHYVVSNGVSRTLCGKPAEVVLTSTDADTVNCGSCDKRAGFRGCWNPKGSQHGKTERARWRRRRDQRRALYAQAAKA